MALPLVARIFLRSEPKLEIADKGLSPRSDGIYVTPAAVFFHQQRRKR